jgi:tRNA A-37 threonylcarbamoyl transferase component Bud32
MLGEGACGEVHRARDPILDRDVALKLRRRMTSDEEESGRRFVEEARRLARVHHPNVLAIHGADIHGGRVGIWTELVVGNSLREYAARRGTIDSREAAAIGIDLCRALAAVHHAGLVHGDVKCANIFREEGGRVVLGDFGSASEKGSQGTVSGSPVSVAPEVLEGAAPDPAGDIYSLGVLLYFLVSGRYPVEGDDLPSLLEAHRTGRRVPLVERNRALPSEFVEVIERSIAPDPADRHASVVDLENALAAVLDTGTSEANADPTSPPPTWWKGRSLLLVVGIAVALAIGTAVFRPILAPSSATPVAPVAQATLYVQAPDGALPVSSGAIVAPGDRLFLEVANDEELHLYVVNGDEAGEAFVLFPVAGLDLENPLPPGEHRLPGSVGGMAQDWRVTSAGGTETFLVMAAREPLGDLEHRLAAWEQASADRPVNSDPGSEIVTRGIGGLADAPVARGAAEELEWLERRLADLEEGGDIVWSRRIILRSAER